MLIVGNGAMNFDIIYQVEDLESTGLFKIGLSPGREMVMGHKESRGIFEILKERGRLLSKSGGGSAANTICALAALGHECFFVGSIGEDEEGEFLLESMKGVSKELIVKRGRSSICLIVIDEKTRDRAMVVIPGDFYLPEKGLLHEVFNECDLFHFSSLAFNEGPQIQSLLLDILPEKAITSFDPGEVYAKMGISRIRRLFEKTALLFLTDFEMKEFFGEENIFDKNLVSTGLSEKAFNRFALFNDLSLPVIIEKMGRKGAKILSQKGEIFSPAKEVKKVVDNTGAGDAFDAGFINGLLNGKDAKGCLKEAIDIATFSLGFPGREWISMLNES